MTIGDIPPNLYWNDAVGYLMPRPLEGCVMPPMPDKIHAAASIICGHGFIQRLSEDEQAEFESFVRDVLATIR